MQTSPQVPDTGYTGSLERFAAAIAMSEAKDRLVKFLEIYEEARQTKLVPTRDDLGLRQLARFLPDITIMERPEPGKVIYRLMGTAVAERMGADLTGQNFLDYLKDAERARNDLGLGFVSDIPCGTFAMYDNQYASGVLSRNESMMLPIDAGSGEAPYQILGMHLTQNPFQYGEEQGQSVIAVKWRDGMVIDLGRGLPDPAILAGLQAAGSSGAVTPAGAVR